MTNRPAPTGLAGAAVVAGVAVAGVAVAGAVVAGVVVAGVVVAGVRGAGSGVFAKSRLRRYSSSGMTLSVPSATPRRKVARTRAVSVFRSAPRPGSPGKIDSYACYGW